MEGLRAIALSCDHSASLSMKRIRAEAIKNPARKGFMGIFAKQLS
jgi:hypothetical protein